MLNLLVQSASHIAENAEMFSFAEQMQTMVITGGNII